MSKAAKKKEEERVEKIIRNLLKLPENRRCINCTSLTSKFDLHEIATTCTSCEGPQYVCTTFWTFVCTNCSGLHREFTHRVKSVSMAKFSAEELSALQAGGNERAREIYFKVWDPQRHTFPDGSNQNRLRDFIRQVYVDKKYIGESTTKLAVAKTDLKEEALGRRSLDSCSKSPVDERRSSQYRQETVKSKRRPARFEIVDDRFRDDDYSRGKRSDANRADDAKRKEKTIPPEVRSIRDILGEDIPPLRVGISPEDDNDAKSKINIGPQEESVSSSAKEPDNAKPAEVIREQTVSLIDLMDDPGPLDPQIQETSPSTSSPNGELFKSPEMGNVSNASQVNSLELMLFEEVPSNVDSTNDGSQITTYDDINSTTQQIVPPAGASCDQGLNLSPAPSTQIPTNSFVIETFQSGLNVDITSQTGHQASSAEANSRERGELPMDLFSGSYPPFQPAVQNWQYRPPYGMGFDMYQNYPPNSVPGLAFPNLASSTNPFDLNDTVTQAQTPMYPSMLPVQEAALHLTAYHSLSSVSHTNSFQLMQSQPPPYQNMPPSQIPTYGISPMPGAFSEQQLPYGVPLSGSQGDNQAVTGQQNDPFASLSPIQQRPQESYSVPPTANSFASAGGNPFG